MKTWGRLYSGTRNHRKIRILREECPGFWQAFYILLELAFECDDGGRIYITPDRPYDLKQLANELGIAPKKTENLLNSLQNLKILSRTDDGFLILNSYCERQYESDNSTERVRKYREKQKSETEMKRFRNVPETVYETEAKRFRNGPETETEYRDRTETEQKQKILSRNILYKPEVSTPPISPPAVPSGETLGGSPSGSPRGDSIFSPGLKNDELAEAESSTGNHDPANKTREKFPGFSEIAESALPAVINSDISPFKNNPEAEPAESSPAAFAAVEDREKTKTSNFSAAAPPESAGNVLAGAAGSPEASSPEEKSQTENVIAFPGPFVPAENQSSFSPGLKVPSDGGRGGGESEAGSSGGPEPSENVQSGPRSGEKKKAKPKAVPVPYQEIVDAWNENAPENLPRVANLNDKRRRMLKAAWKDHPDLEWWRSYFADIKYSDWHAGRKEWDGVDFEWAIKNREKLRDKLNTLKPKQAKPKEPYHPPWLPPEPPEPPEEELLTPDRNCPICSGRGFTNNGLCKCLHPVIDRNGGCAAKHAK